MKSGLISRLLCYIRDFETLYPKNRTIQIHTIKWIVPSIYSRQSVDCFMATEYIVCRTARVVLDFMAGIGLPQRSIQESTFNAPILIEGAKVFSTKKDAEAYCKRMNEELHGEKIGPNGEHYIDLAPYTDYYVLPIAKGTSSDAGKRK